jgi:hypothetical protein
VLKQVVLEMNQGKLIQSLLQCRSLHALVNSRILKKDEAEEFQKICRLLKNVILRSEEIPHNRNIVYVLFASRPSHLKDFWIENHFGIYTFNIYFTGGGS